MLDAAQLDRLSRARDRFLAYELGRQFEHLRYVARRGPGESWCVFSSPALPTTTLPFPTLAPGYPADGATATLAATAEHLRAGQVACHVAAIVALGDLPTAARTAFGHLDGAHVERIAAALDAVPAPAYPPARDLDAEAAYGALAFALRDACDAPAPDNSGENSGR